MYHIFQNTQDGTADPVSDGSQMGLSKQNQSVFPDTVFGTCMPSDSAAAYFSERKCDHL